MGVCEGNIDQLRSHHIDLEIQGSLPFIEGHKLIAVRRAEAYRRVVSFWSCSGRPQQASNTDCSFYNLEVDTES